MKQLVKRMKKRKTIKQPMFYEEPQPAKCEVLDELSQYENLKFEEDICENECDHIRIQECEFHDVTFHGSMRDGQFTDVIFDHCDFSNIDLSESAFRRCEFLKCRMVGTQLLNCSFEDIVIDSTRGDYVNFNASKWKNASLQQCRFPQGGFSMMQCKNLWMEESWFEESEWIETPLRDLDFSDSQINGFKIRPQDLYGVIMNEEQAVECARLLGIVVK